MAAFLAINTLGLGSVRIGPVTIPRLPTHARFLSETSGLPTHVWDTLYTNASTLFRLLAYQTDGLIYNAFEPFGYFYKVTLPLAIAGVALIVKWQAAKPDPRRGMLIAWLATCVLFGIIQPININRINVIFFPILACIAVLVDWLGAGYTHLYAVFIVAFLLAFGLFHAAYHGPVHRAVINRKFHTGLLPALQYATHLTSGPICMTNSIDQPYLYALFIEKLDPRSVTATLRYADAPGDIRMGESMTRYTFGTHNCLQSDSLVYVLTIDETPPHLGKRYTYEFFDQFVVYFPRR